jgi:CheY-like chemotaxis protein
MSADGPLERPLRVVVIDDRADSSAILKVLLEHLGQSVEIAASGQQGVDLVRTSKPDLVLSDLMLPDMNGCEVAKALRADAQCAAMYLVAVTGRSGDEDKREALAAGFDAFFVKPIGLTELAALVVEQRQRLEERKA